MNRKLEGQQVPVIGFAGAPLTLAVYMIEGETSRDFHRARKFLMRETSSFEKLLQKLAKAVAEHLIEQVRAGAGAVQIFDTWGGLLSRDLYKKIVLPSLRQVIDPIKTLGVPVILYVNGSAQHLETMKESGADVLSVDWRLSLADVRKRIGYGHAIQGNLDPTYLYQHPSDIEKSTAEMLYMHPEPGLIANLGHGILPDTPVENARAFISTVKNWKC